MKKYESKQAMQSACIEYWKGELGLWQRWQTQTEEPDPTVGVLQDFYVRDRRYRLLWQTWEHSPFTTLVVGTWEKGGFYETWEEIPEGTLKKIVEPLKRFQGSYKSAEGRWVTFHGFGMGLDPEEHRQICELIDLEGDMWRMGTTLTLNETHVHVPHRYYRDLGATIRVNLKDKRPAVYFPEGLQEYRERLTRDAATVELLKRTYNL